MERSPDAQTLTYEVKALPVPKGWVQKVKRSIVRWGEKCYRHQGTRQGQGLGIRGELGWTTIKWEVISEKYKYVEQIRRIDEGRWSRKIV